MARRAATEARSLRLWVSLRRICSPPPAVPILASTANLQHTPAALVNEIGQNGPANHQYDIDDWFRAVDAGRLPSVSFVKAPSYEDAHPGDSNPLDEQQFIAKVVNYLQQHDAWASSCDCL
jgi:phospholipase C